MIKTFKNKGLASLLETGNSRIDKRMHKRILIRLAVINEATSVEDINLPGYIPWLAGLQPQTLHRPCERPLVSHF
jgi:plasmid maintenance system killer protein